MRIEPPNDRVLLPDITIDHDHINRFLSAEPKLCECGLKNHGWNKQCACGKLWDTFIDEETVRRLRNYGQ